MPRQDWNTPTAHTKNRRHKRMKSGHKGKGHDYYLRLAKREISLSQPDAVRARARRQWEKRGNKPRGYLVDIDNPWKGATLDE